MAHYDSECPHCKAFGVFVREDCECHGAREARNKAQEQKRAEAKANSELLQKYGAPYSLSDGGSFYGRSAADWLRQLEASGRLRGTLD